MDRRAFAKILTGAITAPVMLPALTTNLGAEVATPSIIQPGTTEPRPGRSTWEYTVLDPMPPMSEVSGLQVADVDGDGKLEVVVSGNGSLMWYRPVTLEKGLIANGTFNVGITIGDVDDDGRLEIVVGKAVPPVQQYSENWSIVCFKLKAGGAPAWDETVIDPQTTGAPHDMLLADLDNDGRPELIANSMYCSTPGMFIYKSGSNLLRPWAKVQVQQGLSAEGTSVADLDGDGRLEIVCGPYWFRAPAEGPLSGVLWHKGDLAPGFREMCRTVTCDVNGDGKPDVVIVESEYPDGRLAWFENRTGGEFVQHDIDRPFNFAHSLKVWPSTAGEPFSFFIGEMNEGGWDAPYNWDARLLRFTSIDHGASWNATLLSMGEGTHEAIVIDIDHDGRPEILGHSAQIHNKGTLTGWVQMFKEVSSASPFTKYQHMLLDRQKPGTATDLVIADVDGDGRQDIVCGNRYYRDATADWVDIPGVYQVINAYDIDGDGKLELIATKWKPGAKDWYGALNSDLYWLKAMDPAKGQWSEHHIGTGDGDWPHGNAIAPLLPNGQLALVIGFHDHKDPPQIFEVPRDPTQQWPKRVLANIPYGEEIVAADLNGDGHIDLACGPWMVQNMGDGTFRAQKVAEGVDGTARCVVADMNGSGRPDIIVSVEDLDFNVRHANFAPVAWLENTGTPNFKLHVIDRVRSPHSIAVADLDGDGEMEVVVGEHDPFKPLRAQCRLYVYKRVDKAGTTWKRYVVDDRFEHHDGAKLLLMSNGRHAIVSHGWIDNQYLHLWLPPATSM